MTVVVKVPNVSQPTDVEKFDENGHKYATVEPGGRIALAKGEALAISGIVLEYLGSDTGVPIIEFGEPA